MLHRLLRQFSMSWELLSTLYKISPLAPQKSHSPHPHYLISHSKRSKMLALAADVIKLLTLATHSGLGEPLL